MLKLFMTGVKIDRLEADYLREYQRIDYAAFGVADFRQFLNLMKIPLQIVFNGDSVLLSKPRFQNALNNFLYLRL